MYYKELETNADARKAHNDNLMRQAAERMKTVKAKMKLKKKEKTDE